jgi:hypothetical protein
MKRFVLICMLVGFAVPIFWGILSFVLFNAPESPLTDLYWDAVHVTSPAWLITPSSTLGEVATPFLNALFYGAAATLIALATRILRHKDDSA